jgi:hypothetical protein
VRWTVEDVDGDGRLDLLLFFKTESLVLSRDAKEATLAGTTKEGIPFSGTDTVKVVPRGK